MESRRESFIENGNTSTPLDENGLNNNRVSIEHGFDQRKIEDRIASDINDKVCDVDLKSAVSLTEKASDERNTEENRQSKINNNLHLKDSNEQITHSGNSKDKCDTLPQNNVSKSAEAKESFGVPVKPLQVTNAVAGDRKFNEEMRSNDEDTTDHSESDNSSSLLNELANNILVSQINKMVFKEKIDYERTISSDLSMDSESSCTSGKSLETILSKATDDVKEVGTNLVGTEVKSCNLSESKPVEAKVKNEIDVEVTRNVVKQGRAFFENRSNSQEFVNNNNNVSTMKTKHIENARNLQDNNSKQKNTNETIRISQINESLGNKSRNNNEILKYNQGNCDIAIKTNNSNELPSNTRISEVFVNDEELTIDNNSFINFNTDRDEEIQSMILKNNLKEHEKFLIESNATPKPSTCNSSSIAVNDILNNKLCDTSKTRSNPLIDEINTMDPSVNDPKAVSKYLSTINHDNCTPQNKIISQDDVNQHMSNIHLEASTTVNNLINDVNKYMSKINNEATTSLNSTSSNSTDSTNTVCNSCVGASNTGSCDLMNKSCDYLINNIDQVLEHINSNTGDIVRENELLETHLSNESILKMTHDEKQPGQGTDGGKSNGKGDDVADIGDANDAERDEDNANQSSTNQDHNEHDDNEESVSEDVTNDNFSDEDEIVGNLQDEKLLRNAMKHLPRHKSLDLSDDSMPFILSPKVCVFLFHTVS